MAQSAFDNPCLSDQQFQHLAGLVESHAGIRMPPGKRTMLEGRLRRRLRERGMNSFTEYCRYLFDEGGLDEELGDLIDVVTTNKTDFFREPRHFDILVADVLPELAMRGIGLRRPLRVWSAGSSIGAEAYTLAMVLSEQIAAWRDFDFQILGTDICATVLRTATRAIYPEEMAAPVAPVLRQRYLLRSCDRRERLVRIVPALRARAAFRQLNFMTPHYRLPASQDVVFCRNVIIYFDNAVRAAVLSRICDCIDQGGYLFMGHSETITGFDLPLRQIAPTVYVRL
ncbi:MAG: CheR family methyltransferase [Rhodospirillaceae bacterium]